jgi:Ca2+-dependent lipid-binding protein
VSPNLIGQFPTNQNSTNQNLVPPLCSMSSKQQIPRPIARLNVHVLEGKNMPAMDWTGSSDCFATITLGKITQKTNVIMKCLQPVWNEHLEFEVYDLNDDLNILIADWDRFKKNDKIGEVSYPLSKLANGKNEIWLDLPIIDDCSPSIHLILQLQPKVSITVIEGKNLAAMDWNGKSDPYVEVIYMSNKKRTSTVLKNLNPKWNETFDFDIWDMTSIIYVNVWDWDLIGGNDAMGSSVVTLTSLKNGVNDIWLA